MDAAGVSAMMLVMRRSASRRADGAVASLLVNETIVGAV